MNRYGIIAILCFSFAAAAIGQENNIAPEPGGRNVSLATTRARLLDDFNQRLKNPESYKLEVAKSCRTLPEGDLVPFLYPAMAYVNVALVDPAQLENSLAQAQKLIDLAIPNVIKNVNPPEGRLENLRDYGGHGVYLGQLNMALGAYALISDDGRYDELHSALSEVLFQALEATEARPLQSFQRQAWPFDTIPVLISLKLYELKHGGNRAEALIQAHLEWIQQKATDSQTGLPYSRVNILTGQRQELPRGCDLSLRLSLLPHLDREYARKQYELYVKHFWLERQTLSGFAEWPGGKTKFEDIDSGPILFGIGLSATGLGIGAARANGDEDHLQRLVNQFALLDQLRPMLLQMPVQLKGELGRQLRHPDSRYITGFLFGDTMLFYGITWADWTPDEEAAEPQPPQP